MSSAPVSTLKTSDAGVGADMEDVRHEVKQEKIIVRREAQQWFDVGFIKNTSCTVSHYHLPSENGQNSDVRTQTYLLEFEIFLSILEMISAFVFSQCLLKEVLLILRIIFHLNSFKCLLLLIFN